MLNTESNVQKSYTQIISKKQPKELTYFFLTEMWERYGFYVIQAILILYLIDVYKMTDEVSYGVLGSVTALSYGNAVLGGIIADRWLNQRASVLFGAAMLSLGYSLIAILPNINHVYFAFALITMGTGLLKPNICSMVGHLYKRNDPRRHSGFTYFYVGINLGIILGETLASIIQRYYGWNNVFFSASFVLIIAFAIFWYGTRNFTIKYPNTVRKKNNWLIALPLILASIFISYHVISYPDEANLFFCIVAIACVLFILYQAYISDKSLRHRLFCFLFLVAISTLYWSMYFQMFFSMNLFIERVVDRTLFGITLVPAVYPSIEALAVIVIGPILAWLWLRLADSQSHFNPSIPMKFTLALLFQTIAFGVFYLSSLLTAKNGLIMPGWLIISYIFIAVAELLVMPIGLAMVGELLPQRLEGIMVGIFFISLGLGGKLAGIFANISQISSEHLNNLAVMESIYQQSFLIYFIGALLVTLVSFALVPTLKRWASIKNV